ncbi:hypothetical protein [Profundibacterium mesophilum]|uniref:Glycosyl transferase n=1 Tax=Profundibacterium mesophilum KAUST100406-0324 TaxID=1037889 RepID=A0A921NR24_9RHOB|nr:hypothetical protein [Profundibacterium mesophilum]KAF0675995.1 hypothetical protein PMES_01750 [Profundibacterium mesophilum KAUST100406-0324]
MIQIVMVKWGSKYSANYVNGIAAETRVRTQAATRFICYTDDGTGIAPGVEVRPFPEFGIPLKALTGRNGSLPKMSMFMRGQLEEGVPTIYIDLDTSILGDVARLAECLERRRAVYFLQRHAVPYWRAKGLVDRIAPERYYLGNTAVMAFYPEDTYQIADLFLEKYPAWAAGEPGVSAREAKLFKGGNELLVSAMARDITRVFPRDMAIKFTQEYMAPSFGLAEMRNRLPHVKARRARQVALTYHGEPLKPEHLVDKTDGERVVFKHHKTIWRYPRISAYWRRVIDGVMPVSEETR